MRAGCDGDEGKFNGGDRKNFLDQLRIWFQEESKSP